MYDHYEEYKGGYIIRTLHHILHIYTCVRVCSLALLIEPLFSAIDAQHTRYYYNRKECPRRLSILREEIYYIPTWYIL